MKHLFPVFCASLLAFVSSTALAWSPLDFYRSIDNPDPQCYSLIAGSEENQQENENNDAEEEEEEPDCD